jgi:hypothetical protein
VDGKVVKNKVESGASSSLEKASLIKLRLKAMRSGIWFKALSRIDRVLVNLTIQVANSNIHSLSLINRLLSVTDKLEGLLESRLSRATKEFGYPLAFKFSSLAQSWGNKLAKAWANDFEFAKFLTVMNINSGPYNG